MVLDDPQPSCPHFLGEAKLNIGICYELLEDTETAQEVYLNLFENLIGGTVTYIEGAYDRIQWELLPREDRILLLDMISSKMQPAPENSVLLSKVVSKLQLEQKKLEK